MSQSAHNIIDLCKAGDRRSQQQLYQMYNKAMFNVCYRMLNNRSDAEDVLQIAFVNIFKRMEQYRYESTLGAWIKTIVINQCLSFLRSKKPTAELDESHSLLVDESQKIDDEDIDYKVKNIQKAIQMLPEGYRLVLSMYLFEGLTHEEIGAFLDISESTSKSQYHRGKKKLLEIMRYND